MRANGGLRGRPGQGGPHDEQPDRTDTTAAQGAPAPAPSARLAWFPVYPGDMLSETRGWPLTARGAYYELLAAQWDTGVLPRDPRRLRQLVSATPREWRSVWPLVQSKFPIANTGRQNPTLEARRREAHELRARRRAGAQQTNAARWGDRSAAPSPIAQQLAERVASTTTVTDTEETTQKRTGLRDAAIVVDPKGAGR